MEGSMGCNSLYHHPSCICGFGGQNYRCNGVSGISNVTPTSNLSPYFQTYWSEKGRGDYKSYTIPNAKCPECDAVVFFYQSSNGGRVFFDELGPPWPKHHCTDKPVQSLVPLEYQMSAEKIARKIKWQEDGWEPVLVLNSSQNKLQTILRIVRIGADSLKFYIATTLDYPLSKDGLVFIRETDNLGVFDISYLDTTSDFLTMTPQQAKGSRYIKPPSQEEVDFINRQPLNKKMKRYIIISSWP
jgi:hypothetical protein